ncbi:hypothetical protein BCIN_14g04070 [Botrytis cinerea B05.10]|uniref:SET domain-containing protein n=3 Tax=Botryotinia fuckeliana TaxID=40559 RepID=A0A384K398_BOTFB|nr:hypothetical protein BCIN_14g04070 [Botrytis cinerea B05.10]ATZ57251.1 hypothetical protein BCIN_14g04070 [Botrytis cinerea B05.10]EMR84029.1 putative set domain-containing protein [Botrytis cinerea BcDW1]
MLFSPLPLSSLPAWCKLNNVDFLDTIVSSSKICLQGENTSLPNGIITTKTLSSVDAHELPTLLDIPSDLILGKDFLLEMERVDSHFKQLREAVGGKSIREDAKLFLLLQMTIARNNTNEQPEIALNIGVNNPWSEYIRFLPEKIPVPTMWTEDEKTLLNGTSLENSLVNKMVALSRDFENLREKTIEIPWCHSCWWKEDGPLKPLLLSDWIRVDAWYRSRCLEIETGEEVMVPVLDMVNHSFTPNAHWEHTSNGNAILVLVPDILLDEGTEITISYGVKSDAENLFNYGFIDAEVPLTSLILEVEPIATDPLRVAKVAAFGKRPSVQIFGHSNGETSWDCPFIYLACLNEEDGLEFKTVQKVDGSQSLKVFWQNADVTESTDQFERLISGHEREDILRFRALNLIRDRIELQLERLQASEEIVETLVNGEMVDPNTQANALELRQIETDVLGVAYGAINEEISDLSKVSSISQLLTSVQVDTKHDDPSAESNEEDDFS